MSELRINNAVSLIDEQEYLKYKNFEWILSEKGYVYTWINGKKSFLARMILGLSDDDNRQADHINRITTDNRNSNLRIVTPRQNCLNRNKPKTSQATSAYKGVSAITSKYNPFQTVVSWCSITFSVYFGTEIECAYGYNCYSSIMNKGFEFKNNVEHLLDEQRKLKIMSKVKERINQFKIKNASYIAKKKLKYDKPRLVR
jgi:hypothetical protein